VFLWRGLDGLPARCWVGDIHVLLLDCPEDLRREQIQARPSWRSRDLEEQAEFGRRMRRNIADQVETSHGTPDDAAAAIAAWVAGRMNGDIRLHF
jgi:dephospho-CoA kinase